MEPATMGLDIDSSLFIPYADVIADCAGYYRVGDGDRSGIVFLKGRGKEEFQIMSYLRANPDRVQRLQTAIRLTREFGDHPGLIRCVGGIVNVPNEHTRDAPPHQRSYNVCDPHIGLVLAPPPFHRIVGEDDFVHQTADLAALRSIADVVRLLHKRGIHNLENLRVGALYRDQGSQGSIKLLHPAAFRFLYEAEHDRGDVYDGAQYIAPESEPGPASDVFAFGVLMFRLATGSEELWERGITLTGESFEGDGKFVWYRELAESCRREVPEDRPSFVEIVRMFDENI